MGGYIFLAVIVLFIIYVISIYNGLVTLRNRFKNAFSQIDVQLQRRYDLIPNLIEVAKGYLKHEKETLEAVIKARNQAMSASKNAAARPDNSSVIDALNVAEGALSGAMGRFMALAEAYPDLKANQSMQQLMEELASTENKIAFSRQHFNDSIMIYNNQREQFPNSIIANFFKFQAAKLLEIESSEARQAVKVKF